MFWRCSFSETVADVDVDVVSAVSVEAAVSADVVSAALVL
jgi:hypothetical protein